MFNERLRELRKKKKLSLEKLAELACSTKSYIWELEKKPDIKPSAELVGRLASVLEVTVEDLLGKEPTDEDTVFFREYKDLNNGTKTQLKSILKALKDNQ